MKITHEKSFEEVKELIPELNLLIITANEIETYHVVHALKPLPGHDDILKIPHLKRTYFIGVFGEYKAVHVRCGNMGTAGALLTATSSIDAWEPNVVLMIGVAMGVDDVKQKIGDVLISETIIEYENQRVGKKTVYRGVAIPPGPILLDRFRNATNWISVDEDGNTAKKIIGPILSGDKLIDNLRLRKELTKNFPHASGAEMEGAGLFHACREKSIQEWILVKGICDYGDGNKNVDKEKRQNAAAQSATSISLSVFSSRVGFSCANLHPVAIMPSFNDDVTDYQEIIENEIITMIDLKSKKEDMHTAVQITVAAFLELNSYQKANVIKALGLDLSSLSNLSAHEMDKEFFLQVKKENLLPKLWEAINNITKFNNQKNPFL